MFFDIHIYQTKTVFLDEHRGLLTGKDFTYFLHVVYLILLFALFYEKF